MSFCEDAVFVPKLEMRHPSGSGKTSFQENMNGSQLHNTFYVFKSKDCHIFKDFLTSKPNLEKCEQTSLAMLEDMFVYFCLCSKLMRTDKMVISEMVIS